MPGREGRGALAALGAGGPGESVFGSWAQAGAIFWQPDWRGTVPPNGHAHEFLVSLFSRSPVCREHSARSSCRLCGAAGEAGVIRTCTEHRTHLDGRPARTEIGRA